MHSTTDLASHSVFLLDQYPLLLFCDVTVVLAGSNRPEAVAWRSALEDCSWPQAAPTAFEAQSLLSASCPFH